MLVLTRRPGEEIVVGNDVRLTIIEIRGNRVRLGVSAPEHVQIRRSEVAPLEGEEFEPSRAEPVCC